MALREIHRVLKPGGVIGVREEDVGSIILAPTNPALEQWFELYIRAWKHDGGDPFFARRHREVLRLAGFTRIEASASSEYYGTPEATKTISKVAMSMVPSVTETALQMGWTTPLEAVEDMIQAWRAWGEHPDAFFADIRCEVVGRKE